MAEAEPMFRREHRFAAKLHALHELRPLAPNSVEFAVRI
jgi:hypothetical protein